MLSDSSVCQVSGSPPPPRSRRSVRMWLSGWAAAAGRWSEVGRVERVVVVIAFNGVLT